MKRLIVMLALVAFPATAQKFEFPKSATPTPSPTVQSSPAPVATPAAAPTPRPIAVPAATPAPTPATAPSAMPVSTPVPIAIAGGPAVEQFVTVYGNRIRYLDTGGNAPAVILIHGMGNDAELWTFNTPAIARNSRVIALDLLGYGKSDKPLIAYRVGVWVDFLDRFLRELSIDRATLVGASLGGWVASAYALQHPERVNGLVLISTGGLPLPKGVGEKELRLLNPTTREATRTLMDIVFFNPLFRTEQALEFVYTKRMSANDGFTNEMLIDSILRGEDVIGGRFSEIRTPTLLVWGREDRLTPLAMIGEPLSRQIPGAKLVVIDEAGHIPLVEQAARFNDAVNEFLETLR